MYKRLLVSFILVMIPGCTVYDGYSADVVAPQADMVWDSGVTYHRDVRVVNEVHRHYYVWHPNRGYVWRSQVVIRGDVDVHGKGKGKFHR